MIYFEDLVECIKKYKDNMSSNPEFDIGLFVDNVEEKFNILFKNANKYYICDYYKDQECIRNFMTEIPLGLTYIGKILDFIELGF